MEYPDNIIGTRSRIIVSYRLRETLLDFTVSCLLEEPEEVVCYAKDYFTKLVGKKKHIELDMVTSDHALTDTTTSYSTTSLTSFKDYKLPDDIKFPSDFDVDRGRGKVVYSEPYNPEKDTDDEGQDVIYEKSDEQKEILMNVVTNCLLFRALEKEQIDRVINVMFPKDVLPGDVVIKQFDDGDNFYIIEFGLFDVFIADSPDAEPLKVLTYQNTGNFGELALLYNMPRAATVKATTVGRLWAMDRQTFRRMVLKAAFKKRKIYEELIAKVPILQELTPYERMSVADALIGKVFQNGEVIISQGESADGMYFIESGIVECWFKQPKEVVKLNELTTGDYFGELALLDKEPRAATVTAVGVVKVAFLDVDAFERLLGPCLELMERAADVYRGQIDQLKSATNIKSSKSLKGMRESIAAVKVRSSTAADKLRSSTALVKERSSATVGRMSSTLGVT